MYEYNHHFPNDATPESLLAERTTMLRGIIGKMGDGTFIEPPVHFDYGCNIIFGDSFYSNFKCDLLFYQPLLCSSIS